MMRAAAFGLALLGIAAPAFAQEIADPLVRVDLLSAAETVAPGDTVRIAVRQQIEPGWHTYWQNPGDVGEAPRVVWSPPEGVTVGDFDWPVPERVPYEPYLNFGYGDEVWLLADLAVPASWPVGQPLEIAAQAEWLVCADICVPEAANLALTVPTGPSTVPDPTLADGFAEAEAALPRPAPGPALFQTDAAGLRLHLTGVKPTDAGEVAFFPFAADAIVHAAPQAWSADADGLTLAMTPADAGPTDRLDGVLVVRDGEGARGFTLAAEPGTVAPQVAAGDLSLWPAIALALLGGLLLNLMPCVFPVLAMKGLGLLKHAEYGTAERRMHGFAYTAGVLVAFGALATILLALRAGGAAVGWGFQLQSPLVVTLLAFLLFAVGLGLSGFLRVEGGWTSVGGRFAAQGGMPGAFATGVLAAVVATPCTAPFMAAALGWALIRPWGDALATFLALGLGLALPFLLLSLFPALARVLPRPGAWMDRLKQALAFPMYASAAWLVWVLAQQAGPNGVLAALTGFVLIAFAVWLLRQTDDARPAGRRVAQGAAMVAVLLALGLARLPAPVPASADGAGAAIPWHTYAPDRLASLRADGRAVFLNVTAAWCITCQVNERLALSGGVFAAAVDSGRLAYLKADWTNADPAITALLQGFGRSGVPLYVLYPADGGSPLVLPQLLTEAIVRDAVGPA